MDLTKISQGKLIINKTIVVVEELLDQTLRILEPDIQHKQIQVQKQYQKRSSNIEADSARIQQVFWNVIKNAVKFTPEKGSVSISTLTTKDRKLSFH